MICINNWSPYENPLVGIFISYLIVLTPYFIYKIIQTYRFLFSKKVKLIPYYGELTSTRIYGSAYGIKFYFYLNRGNRDCFFVKSGHDERPLKKYKCCVDSKTKNELNLLVKNQKAYFYYKYNKNTQVPDDIYINGKSVYDSIESILYKNKIYYWVDK